MIPVNSIGRYAVLGTSGTGKSNSTFVLLAELRRKGQPLVVLDHKGEYINLPGCEYIKAEYEEASSLPSRLRNSKVSVVIDLRGEDNIESWIGDFINGCLKLPRQAPILIAIEEAHEYCPEGAKITKSKKAIRRLAQLGRSNGYGLMLISQNYAGLDKKAVGECLAVYIHRHHGKAQLEYLIKWLGDEMGDRIKQLKTGQVLHLDMVNWKFSTFQMPLSKEKKKGHTPQPVAVKEDKQAFYQPIGRPIVDQQGIPVTAEAEKEDYSMVFVLVVVSLVAIIMVGALIWKATSKEAGMGSTI